MPDYPTPPSAPPRNLPIPATGNPSLERAMGALQKAYPRDMVGVQAAPDWSPSMFTNRTAYVGLNDPSTIHVNGLAGAMYGQGSLERDMAHELEHVRQLRDPSERNHINSDLALPYDERPHEISAEKAADRFDAMRQPGSHDGMIPDVAGKFYYELGKSPAVQGLLNSLNGAAK